MKLTDLFLRNVKKTGKVQKHFDGGGLYLYVTPGGNTLWRMAYRYAGKQKTLSFGEYPRLSLKEAREKREAAKKLLDGGIDPMAEKKEVKAAIIAAEKEAQNTFGAVAKEWLPWHSTKISPRHSKRLERYLDDTILPILGKIPVDEVEARQRIESSRRELADYTGVEHLAQIKAAGEAFAETKREIISLSENPEVPSIRIEDETYNALVSFEREFLAAKNNICTAAAKAQCVSSLPDLPERYRDMSFTPMSTVTLGDLACAAKYRGFYKGFSAGGIFSNDIVLKLETATIYFKEQKRQRETHRPVGSSYTGDDTYTILVATKIETEKGTQEVKNSEMEMLTLSAHMGGIPNVKECQE